MSSPNFFSQMALDLHAETTSARTIDRIVEFAKAATGCADAGVMLVHAHRRMETAASTTPRVEQSHDLQIELDEGPCLDVLEGEPIRRSGDLRRDDRWPRWGPAVADLGFHSVLSLRLRTQERRFGSMNLYSEEPDFFGADEVAVATIFVEHASVAVATAQDHEGLQEAIDARTVIGQAQGILMERFDIEPDRAFNYLRRQSQDHNIKLHAVAQWVVDHRNASEASFPPRA